MHPTQKVKFIKELIRNVQADIIKNVGKMPDDWNGLELRLYVADKFAQGRYVLRQPKEPSSRLQKHCSSAKSLVPSLPADFDRAKVRNT
jgi:hypothetical protein